MTNRSTTHSTGAEEGLGPETAHRSIEVGQPNPAGTRYVWRGQAAADMIRAHLVRLEVTDEASLEAAAEVMRRLEGRDLPLLDDTGSGRPDVDSATTVAVTRRFFETKLFRTVWVEEGLPPLAGIGSSGDPGDEQRTGPVRRAGRPDRTAPPAQRRRGQPPGGRRFDADHSVRQSIPQGPAKHG